MDAMLPPEILKEIFVKIANESNVVRCRLVCKSWKAAVDDLGDAFWKKVCEKSYFKPVVYEKVHNKSSIPWVDVYRAVHLWSHVRTAEVLYCVLPATAQKFKLLPNRMIAVLTTSNGNSASGDAHRVWDTIIYYDVDTSEELKRNQYDKPILRYDENEHLIVLLSSDGDLTVIQKNNNKKEFIGKVLKKYDSYNSGFRLFGHKVYYQNENSLVSVSKLFRTKDMKVVRKTVTLKERIEYIVTFGKMYGSLTVLTTHGLVLAYDAKDEEYTMLAMFKWDHSDILYQMHKYGFDWLVPEVYQWLIHKYENKIKMSQIKHHSFFLHGRVGLLGTSEKSIVHIYENAFKAGKLSVYKVTPTRSIDMTQFLEMPDGLKDNPITQIDVMESADHHLVFVLTGERVFILKIGFSGNEEMNDESKLEYSSPNGHEEIKVDDDELCSACESEEMASDDNESQYTSYEEMETDEEEFDEEELDGEDLDDEELDDEDLDDEGLDDEGL